MGPQGFHRLPIVPGLRKLRFAGLLRFLLVLKALSILRLVLAGFLFYLSLLALNVKGFRSQLFNHDGLARLRLRVFPQTAFEKIDFLRLLNQRFLFVRALDARILQDKLTGHRLSALQQMQMLLRFSRLLDLRELRFIGHFVPHLYYRHLFK